MRKRFTKIICVAVATVLTLGSGILSACNKYYTSNALSGDRTGEVTSNGGFLVEKGNYIYFINGAESYTADNTYGDVLKGSVQRISKSDFEAHNYSNTKTVVHNIVYSGNSNAGIYIYGDYIYYSTPTSAKNSSGEVQNSYLEFKRTSLDGSKTMTDYYYQASDNSVEYRYVEVDGTVYLLYALSESLYGSSTTNIHSVNTKTGKNTLLAYDVSDYEFDTENVENPYVYYTMNVTLNIGTDNAQTQKNYNQVYRVCANSTTSVKSYNFSDVDGYSSSSNPLYINLGEYVFDGVGYVENSSSLCQFNYKYGEETFDVKHNGFTYTLNSYKNGVLSYTRKEADTSVQGVYRIEDKVIDGDGDGKVDASWEVLPTTSAEYAKSPLIISGSDANDYYFYDDDGNKIVIDGIESGVYSSSVGVSIATIEEENGNKVVRTKNIASCSSPTILSIKKEQTTADSEAKLYIYYMVSGAIYRVAADAPRMEDYADPDVSKYTSVQILDVTADTSWYAPEFVDNQLVFLATSAGYDDFDYVMVCDLTGSDKTHIMSNQELYDYKEQMDGVFDDIDDRFNSDDQEDYDTDLAQALQYLFYTGDSSYMAKLVKANKTVNDEDDYYSTDALAFYKDFANCTGSFADYASAENTKTINGKEVHSNSQDYYYTLLGRMTSSDKKELLSSYRSSYMKTYPTKETVTWWGGLNTAAKVLFVLGMVGVGLSIIGIGTLFLLQFLVSRKNNGGRKDRKYKVDITDDKDIDVYGDDDAIKEE